MKFLPEDRYFGNITPLNVIYDKGVTYGDDKLTLVFKDVDSGEHFTHIIYRPLIEVYIVKPEYRTFKHIRDFVPMEFCYPLKVHYATRWNEIAKHMGLPSGQDARISPYVFNADRVIDSYYLQMFDLEYPNDKEVTLSMGYLDIENDIINLDRWPEKGETPINAVTYTDAEKGAVYTFLLGKSNIIMPEKGHPMYYELKELEDGFMEQLDYFKSHISEFIAECHERFDEVYGELEYNIYIFDDEKKLHQALWAVIHASDNDYIGIWNEAYDIPELIQRATTIGLDTSELIPDERFGPGNKVYFYEDMNPVIHRKRHDFATYTIPTFIDTMINYSGIRIGKGNLASHKLNYIGKLELNDEKIDHSEYADMKYFAYRDWWKFCIYNIKDVLLMMGIDKKTHDPNTIYSRMKLSMTLPKDSFLTTKVVYNALVAFSLKEGGLVPGSNRNKFAGAKDKGKINYENVVSNIYQNGNHNSDLNLDAFIDAYEDDDDGKDDKYDGAFIANTLHMTPTGTKIMGRDTSYVHRFVGDEDITSQYPSAIIIGNKSNETLVGKVYLHNPEKYQLPIYKSLTMKGDDLSEYKFDPSNFLLECLSQDCPFNFCSIFLGLPSPDKVLDEIDSCIDELTK